MIEGEGKSAKHERDVIVSWHQLQAARLEVLASNSPRSRHALLTRASEHLRSADEIAGMVHWSGNKKDPAGARVLAHEERLAELERTVARDTSRIEALEAEVKSLCSFLQS